MTMIFFVWLLTLPSPVPCEWASLGLTWDCIDISTSIELGQARSIFVEKELQRVNREAMADLDGKGHHVQVPTDLRQYAYRIGSQNS